jgi:hypothetical protein
MNNQNNRGQMPDEQKKKPIDAGEKSMDRKAQRKGGKDAVSDDTDENKSNGKNQGGMADRAQTGQGGRQH